MHMKYYIITILLFSQALCAQEIDHVKLRIHYTEAFKKWVGDTDFFQDEKVLDIGDNISKFYSLWENTNEMIRDSVLKRGGTFQEVQNALGKSPYPRSYQYAVVYKNYPQKGQLTYTDRIFIKTLRYQEPMEKQQWQIVADKADTIAGYRCQQAKTSFRGREWTVWFTMDIPIHDGPWKLCGLPGLILKAEDSKKDFRFECIQIENIKNKKAIILPKLQYIKCSRAKLQQQIIQSGKDPDGYLRQLGYDVGRGYDAKGRPLKYGKTCMLLEY